MLVLSREIGQAIVIDDVVITVVRVTPEYAEITLQKVTGGKKVIATLPLNEYVDACYNTQIVFITSRGNKARFGVEAPADLPIYRYEVWDTIR